MLVLVFKVGESVKFGQDIEVSVNAITAHDKVAIGVSAPKSVPITRLDEVVPLDQGNKAG